MGTSIAAAVACLVATAAPARADEARGSIPPPVVEHGGAGVGTAGLTAFGTAYAASVFAAASSGRGADGWLLVPVFGPWFDLAESGCRERPCPAARPVLLVADGLLQAGGVVLMAAGAWVPRATVPLGRGGESMSIEPARVGRDAWGLAASGRF